MAMRDSAHELTPKLVDSLYTEAMVQADEARSYFDSERSRAISPAEVAVAFSCESLKVTTRLMHVIAWLLNQKALRAGELDSNSNEALGYAPATDSIWIDELPEEARSLILASEDLYYRVQRVSESVLSKAEAVSEPLAMIERIRAAF
jgi:regulator of CtrA degradation